MRMGRVRGYGKDIEVGIGTEGIGREEGVVYY